MGKTLKATTTVSGSDLEIFVQFDLAVTVCVKLIEQFMHLLPGYGLALFLK